MDTYEELQDAACKDGIDVIDYPFKSKKILTFSVSCDNIICTQVNFTLTPAPCSEIRSHKTKRRC